MMLRALLLAGCFMLDSTRAAEEASLPRKPAGEPLVLDVWPGKVPQDTGVDGDEKFRMYSSPLFEGPTKLITNVTKPMLMVYLPPKEQNTGAAVVICPGGGYHELFWELEGEEVAAWLNAHGIAGIILKYRVPRRAGDAPDRPPLGPQMDAQRAISLVRSKSAEWGIDPKRIGMVGFSVGGHLVVATATGFKKTEVRRHRQDRRRELPARLWDCVLLRIPEGQGQGRDLAGPEHPRRHAANFSNARR